MANAPMIVESADDEFIRDALDVDRDFTIVPNVLARDNRLSGNALAVYIWIYSQAPGFRVTRTGIMRGRGLGKDALAAALKNLEANGYIECFRSRWPRGARTVDGRQLGGASRVQFRLRSPFAAQARRHEVAAIPTAPSVERETLEQETLEQGAPVAAARETSVDQGIQSGAGNPPRAIDSPEQAEVPHSPAQPGSENPKRKTRSGKPALYKKTNLKKTKSSSSVRNEQTAREASAAVNRRADDDDEAKSATRGGGGAPQAASAAVSGVDPDAVVAALGQVAVGVDVPRAIRDVLARATRPVSNPLRFVVAAIKRDPSEWLIAPPQPESVERSETGGVSGDRLGSALARQCSRIGHQWREHGPEGVVCVRCGDQVRDAEVVPLADCAEGPDGHDAVGGDRCRWCGVLMQRVRDAVEQAARDRCAVDGHRWLAPLKGLSKRGIAGLRNGDCCCDQGCGTVSRAGELGRVVTVPDSGRVWRPLRELESGAAGEEREW